jgi:hypothetical protein
MKTPAEIIYEQINLLSDRDFKSWMLNNYDALTPDTYVLVRKDSLEELKDFETWKKWKHGELQLDDNWDEDHTI